MRRLPSLLRSGQHVSIAPSYYTLVGRQVVCVRLRVSHNTTMLASSKVPERTSHTLILAGHATASGDVAAIVGTSHKVHVAIPSKTH